MAAAEFRIKVVYIMGAARSGSTVLDIVLGEHESIESVGELQNLPTSGWLRKEMCACGRTANTCEYWQAVYKRWAEKVGDGDIQRLIDLQDRFERIRYLPRLLRERIRPSRSFKEYGERVVAVYESIQEVSGKNIIVDSGKNPARAYALMQIPRIDLRLIHLVRDGRGVIWSCRKGFNRDLARGLQRDSPSVPAWRTTLGWLVTNLASEAVGRLARIKPVRIRYEDLTADPFTTVERVGKTLDLEMAQLSEALANGQGLRVGHTIAGNRLRMAGMIWLRADLEWKEKLPLEDRRIFWRLAGWLAKQYGYKEL